MLLLKFVKIPVKFMTQILNFKITEPLLRRLLACKVDSWSQSVIDYQRGRKEGGSFRPFTRLSPSYYYSLNQGLTKGWKDPITSWLTGCDQTLGGIHLCSREKWSARVFWKQAVNFHGWVGTTVWRNWQPGDKTFNEIDTRMLSKPLLISARIMMLLVQATSRNCYIKN